MLGSDPIQSNEGDEDLHGGGDGFSSSSGGSSSGSSGGEVESNRPAANANQSDFLEATTEEFEFSEDADDFLGLESEIEALTADGANQSFAENDLEVGEQGELNISEGWLLEVATPENTQAPMPETANADEVAEYVTSELASTGLDEFDEEGDYDEDDYEDGDDEDYAEGEFDEEVEAANPARRRLMIGAGFCVGILGTIGLLMLQDAPADGDLSGDVAGLSQPNPSSPEGESGLPQSGEANANAEASESGSTVGTAESEPIENLLEGLLASPDEVTQDPVLESIPLDPGSELSGADSFPGATGLPGMPDVSPAEHGLSTTNKPQTYLSDLESAGEPADVGGLMEIQHDGGSGFIWTGTEVPTPSIRSNGRVLTPAVGFVRATMNSGELFEGILYAVGENRVWIELGAGRVGLDANKVEKIERILTKSGLAGAAPEPSLGQRVRIRAAGGVLYGKVKSRDGDRVTIVTDKGARITLENPDIEPIGRISGLVLN